MLYFNTKILVQLLAFKVTSDDSLKDIRNVVEKNKTMSKIPRLTR